MSLRQHSIGRAEFAFEFPGQKDVNDAVYLLPRLMQKRLVPCIRDVLDEWDDRRGVWKIDRLKIDLGTVAMERLSDELAAGLRDALHKAFSAASPGDDTKERAGSGAQSRRLTSGQARLEVIIHYLLSGSLPWTADGTSPDEVNHIFATILTESPDALIAFLRSRRGADSPVLPRLARQFPTAHLLQLLGLLAPGRASGVERAMDAMAALHRASAILPVSRRRLVRGLWEHLLRGRLAPHPPSGSAGQVAAQALKDLAAGQSVGHNELHRNLMISWTQYRAHPVDRHVAAAIEAVIQHLDPAGHSSDQARGGSDPWPVLRSKFVDAMDRKEMLQVLREHTLAYTAAEATGAFDQLDYCTVMVHHMAAFCRVSLDHLLTAIYGHTSEKPDGGDRIRRLIMQSLRASRNREIPEGGRAGGRPITETPGAPETRFKAVLRSIESGSPSAVDTHLKALTHRHPVPLLRLPGTLDAMLLDAVLHRLARLPHGRLDGLMRTWLTTGAGSDASRPAEMPERIGPSELASHAERVALLRTLIALSTAEEKAKMPVGPRPAADQPGPGPSDAADAASDAVLHRLARLPHGRLDGLMRTWLTTGAGRDASRHGEMLERIGPSELASHAERVALLRTLIALSTAEEKAKMPAGPRPAADQPGPGPSDAADAASDAVLHRLARLPHGRLDGLMRTRLKTGAGRDTSRHGEMLERIGPGDLASHAERMELLHSPIVLSATEDKAKMSTGPRPAADRQRPEPSIAAVPADDAPLDSIHVLNAGLVLASPYLPRLFDMLGLVEKRRFKDREAAGRALHLLEVLAHNRSAAPEFQLALNKVLCGVAGATPIVGGIDVAPEEQEAVDGLIRSMIAHWKALGNTSPEGLRTAFLQREGFLTLKADAWHLRVQGRSYDMLLDRLPWPYTPIKHPWMTRPIHVDWR